MDEVKTNKVENLPVLEEVPEGATLIAEVDGEFYRVKGDSVGSKKLDVVITMTAPEGGEGNPTLSVDTPYADLLSAIKTGTVGTIVAMAMNGSELVMQWWLTNCEIGLYDNEDGTQTNCMWLRGLDAGVVYLEDGRILMD